MYAMVVIFSPILVPGLLIMHAPKAWRWGLWWLSFGRGKDPYLRGARDWPTDRDSFLGELVARRILFDPRLKGVSIGDWPMGRFQGMPESIMLEAVDVYRDLKSGGAEDWQIWEKLDTWLNVDVSGMAEGAAILDFLKSGWGSSIPAFRSRTRESSRVTSTCACDGWTR